MSSPTVREWMYLTSEELNNIDRKTPVVIPLGSIESHGLHLPLATDTMIAESVARVACAQTNAVLLPPMFYAYIGSPKNYIGAIDTSAELCTELIKTIVRGVFKWGFKKVILINGHAANRFSLEIATRALLDELEHQGLRLQYLSWWDDICRPHHACEVETSMIAAAIGEHAIRKDKIVDHTMQYPTWRISDWTSIAPDTGAVNGTPSKYTIEKGQEYFKASAEKLVALIKEAEAHW